VNERPAVIDVVPAEVLRSYDGLGFLRALLSGALPLAPIMDTMGFRLVDAGQGFTAFEGMPEFRHYNPIGAVHAGFAATLLDSAVYCAVHSTLAMGETATTLEIKINLVRALTTRTGKVRAEGRVIHRGRTTATAEGALRDGGGKLCAHATTTCMIFPVDG
jgi:uncharacterized protein (TIGR00369 family)